MSLFFSLKNNKNPTVDRILPASNEYKYINPLLAVDVLNENWPQYDQLKSDLNNYITKQRIENKIEKVSIFFRNFSDTSWIGISEDEKYKPGSLFKVPIMIAYLKQAETDRSILRKKLKFDNPNDQSARQDIQPTKQIEFGHEYTIEELIYYMIVYSDNSAANILAKGIYLDQKNSYTEMLSDLGLPVFTEEISVKNYALFMRILRNATYLNRDMSEKALGILANVDFKDGLVAGLPKDTVIAHKFGEAATEIDGQNLEQLHDCGIIYYPNHPYLLCVMTQGKNVSDLEETISNVSKLFYQQIQTLYKQ